MSLYRFTLNLACFLAMAGGVSLAHAEDQSGPSGTAVVQDAGSIMLDGKRVYFWGVDPLASDQQCWIAERSWSCGEYAVTALKHFTEGRMIKCVTKNDLGRGAVQAQCSVNVNGRILDIGQFLVTSGWALDKKDISNGLYTSAEESARHKRAGMWSGRFQTPSDWQEGVQRYITPSDDDADDEDSDPTTGH